MHRYLYLLIALPVVLAHGIAAAADNTVDSEELSQLLAVIDEQTEIATKSRLNADYVPGIVTVLRGKDMESRGIRNVWEALSLVPGIELGMEETGRRHIMIRGVGLTYASEAAKLMVNGIAYNTTTFSYADAIYSIPIGQVERIEVIRGPGSAIYGEFAYSGVINVITYQGESRLFAQASSMQHRQGGGVYSFGEPGDGRLYGTLNVAAENTGHAGVPSGYDAAYQMDPAWSYSPGTSNEVGKTRSALLDLGYENITLKMAFLSNGFGDHFGINGELPPAQRIVNTDKLENLQLSINGGSGNYESIVTFGKRRYSENTDKLFLYSVISYCGADPACMASGVKDVFGDIATVEQSNYLSGEVNWHLSDIDTIYVAAGYTDTSLESASMYFNLDPASYNPTLSMYDWSNINPLQQGIKRHVVSATLQNEHAFTESVRTTLGLRFDKYNDVGSSLTPRLAGVWSFDDRHLVKAQYSSAFRPPTFYEMGGAISSIKPSTVDTYELSYIERDDVTVTRVTGFSSHLDDMITFIDNGVDLGYANLGSITLRGVEFEHEHRITNSTRVDGNLSLLRTRDESTGDKLPNAANLLGHVALTYTPTSRWMFNGQYSYVGPRKRDSSDQRPSLKAYSTLDLTLSMRHAFWHGTTLRGGVRNLFDSDIRYPDPTANYRADYPRPGRYWWCGMQLDF